MVEDQAIRKEIHPVLLKKIRAIGLLRDRVIQGYALAGRRRAFLEFCKDAQQVQYPDYVPLLNSIFNRIWNW